MGKILLWLQERVKLWTKPATPILAVGLLSDLIRSRADLLIENALLRQQQDHSETASQGISVDRS